MMSPERIYELMELVDGISEDALRLPKCREKSRVREAARKIKAIVSEESERLEEKGLL